MDDTIDDSGYVTIGDPGPGYDNAQPIAPTWGDTTPVVDPNQPTDYGYSTNTDVYPDPGSPTGYSDIYGNQVDSTGQPVTYDSKGQLVDSNGNVIGQAGPYQYTPTDTTTTTDANGNLVTVDHNGNVVTQNQSGGYDQYGNPLPSTPATTAAANQAIARQLGTTQPGQPGYGQPGYGQPGTNGSSGSSGLLGTLGMLAAGAGVGALLSNLLSNKSSSSSSSAAPAQAANIAPGNLSFNKLATPGVNPGYAMGASSAPVSGLTTNLGNLISPNNVQITKPTNLMPANSPAPLPGNLPAIPTMGGTGISSSTMPAAPVAPVAFAPGSVNPTGLTGQPLTLDQVKSMIGM